MPNYKWVAEVVLTKNGEHTVLVEEGYHTLEDAQKNLLAFAMGWAVKNPSVQFEVVARHNEAVLFLHDKGLIEVHIAYRG